uniref:Uncharacterized protein n=1 Tax=Rhizophora mucronata TaxID=61149 RepID=A0A2P2PKL9_RHIMU
MLSDISASSKDRYLKVVFTFYFKDFLMQMVEKVM